MTPEMILLQDIKSYLIRQETKLLNDTEANLEMQKRIDRRIDTIMEG